MDGSGIIVMLVLTVMGGYCIRFGWHYRIGKNKKPYFATNWRYSYLGIIGIPAGIFWFSLVIGMFIGIFLPETEFLTNLSGFFLFIGIGAVFIGWLVSFFSKSFIYPDWVKWMEEKHSDIINYLRADALEMGLDVWNQKVSTQIKLEEWINEVRKKVKVGEIHF